MLILMNMDVADQFVAKHRAWKIAKEASQGATLPMIDVPKLTKKIGRTSVGQWLKPLEDRKV